MTFFVALCLCKGPRPTQWYRNVHICSLCHDPILFTDTDRDDILGIMDRARYLGT